MPMANTEVARTKSSTRRDRPADRSDDAWVRHCAASVTRLCWLYVLFPTRLKSGARNEARFSALTNMPSARWHLEAPCFLRDQPISSGYEGAKPLMAPVCCRQRAWPGMSLCGGLRTSVQVAQQ